MLTEGEFIALLSLIGSVASAVITAFVFIRTGKVIDSTSKNSVAIQATHDLVNSQTQALLAAAGVNARAEGYAAGQVAPAGVPDATLPIVPPAVEDPIP